MTKVIELTAPGGDPLTQSLPLAADDGALLTVATLRAAAAALLAGDNHGFSLRYTDSDGDEVTVARDADVKELADYMADERLERLTLLVAVHGPPAGALQKQLRGLVTAMAKLTTDKPKQPTPANAVNLLVASLQTMDVADDSTELAAVKRELLAVLQGDEFRQVVDELSASEEFKDLADAMVAAIYQDDAQAIEETATARFDELLAFFQRVVARCPTLKPAMVNVAKKCMSGLVRYNDEELAEDGSDASSSSSSKAALAEVEEMPVHLGVICDGCEKAPVVGVRYRSLEVEDFDLCEDCEASGKWVSHEPFIKITDPSRAPKHKRPTELVHPFVICDGCEMSPLVGIRFKSKTAEDFDLCEACEASSKWNESHGPFTKIEEPGMMHALKFTCRRGTFGHHDKFGHHRGKFGYHGRHGKFGHHGHHGKFGRHGHHGPPGLPFHGPPPHHHGFPPPPHFDGRPDFPPPPHHGGPPDFGGRGRYGHYPPPPPPEFFDRRGRHHHGPPPFGPPGSFGSFSPPPFGFPHPHGPPPCPPEFPPKFDCRGFPGHHGRHGRYARFPVGEEDQEDGERGRRRHGCRGRGRWGRNTSDLEARFLEDVTIEDGTVVEAGKPLRKMWKLVNDGERSWPDGCYMITQPGNPMFPDDRESSRIDLPELAPGEEFIAGVDLVAPSEPGRYTSFWRVCDPADVSFGHRFWIDVVVAAGDAAPETTPSEAPTADSAEDVEIKDASADAASDDDIEIIDSAEAQEADAVAEEGELSENEDKADYKEALDLLASMGFVDQEKNLRALELADGNVGGAVNALLSE
ncbi:hypothetical protein PHYSODRAFT_561623 [Phytophthora sojae]|uniref:ZZ-type domain-containing protein n=1 Tax=Phytophthora sojae (strain P6497) TaxID=1094619 RepID=G4ZQP2_PHYSP|nr:hypothetical protein PHYSODRAFT_561623 [Phytophthora sojae]EGZ15899.1 hypothetical protein PHYSODRAFT_561623 [Phytophthora sojae]|eukprot:XP_009529648.1 hypothetical protein PHYSODRAFT_561623 [Phytophthora sojae]